MAEIFYDKDADLAIIQGNKVAVIGFGSQGLGVFEAATGQRLRASKGRNKQENLLGLASHPHPLLPRTRPAKNGRA